MEHIRIVVVLSLIFIGCTDLVTDPVTRCIAYGHEIGECIELAKALNCNKD